MNRSKSKKGRSLLPFFLFCVCVSSAQNKNSEMYKSTYKVTTSGLSLKVADTVFKQMEMPRQDMSISLGTVYYTNYYKDGLSKTEVKFVDNPGIQQLGETKPVNFYAKPADSVMIQYEDGKLVSKSRFSLPKLKPSGEKKLINGYESQLYTYTSPENMKIKIWASKHLSSYITPGIYYKELGGIISIQYEYKNQAWSIDLLHFAISKEQVEFKAKELKAIKGPATVHYLMAKD